MTISAVTKTDRTDVTYNLTVADFETYFVGVNKVLVHNCPAGSYTNTHASGKAYDGKGDPNRAAISGQRIANVNNDPHLNTETRTASTDRESIKQESGSHDQNGGSSSASTYNKIDSPGTKYREEDAEVD